MGIEQAAIEHRKFADLVAEQRHEVTGYIQRDGGLPEADDVINRRSQAIVRAMYREEGVCWLGRFNRHREGHELYDKFPLWQFDPEGVIYNFDADFCVVTYSQRLADILMRRWTLGEREGFNFKRDAQLIDKATERLEAIDAVHLWWT